MSRHRCIICDDESHSMNMAMGSCNHPICSVCAARLRFKSKDYKCVMCKQTLDIMIVSDNSSNQMKTFQEYDLFGNSAAGGVTLEEASMLFVNCLPHYHAMKSLLAFHCPHPSCKASKHRFQNEEAVIQHVESKHQKTMCRLCVSHRALFMSEHNIYSPKDMKKHMSSAIIHTGTQSSGHPPCKFCNCNFYDAADLFTHMRNEHFTCRFCPLEHQFRYYRNRHDLNFHISESHLTCLHPNCLEGSIAFRTREEYSNHLMIYHNTTDERVRIGFHYGSNPADSRRTDDCPYLDLYAASPDPNIPTPVRSSTLSSYVPLVVTSSAPSIPPNMRIAGKVKNGNLKKDSSDAEFESAMSAQYASAARAHHPSRAKPNLNAEEFPSLSISTTADGIPVKKSILSEMSSLTKERLRKTAEAERLRKATEQEVKRKEQEDLIKRKKRNEEMAHALGVMYRSPLSGAVDESITRYVHPSILHSGELEIPVFTVELITWTKNNLIDVLRIEKRIQTFISDKKATSLNLKPMKSFYRDLLHDLAKYYQLHSHEYDPEPYRYVCLVKSIDSEIPRVLLSTASKQQVYTLSSQLQDHDEPTLFFSLRYTAAGLTLSIFINRLLAELSTCRTIDLNLLNGHPLITSLKMIGTSAIAVQIASKEAATELYSYLIELKAMSAAKSNSQTLATTTAVLMGRAFLDLFEIECGFAVDDYLSLSHGHIVSSPGSVAQAETRPTQAEWQRVQQRGSANNLASLGAAFESGGRSTDVGNIVVDSRHVKRPKEDSSYLDWQFKVGGQVSVAYAVCEDEEEDDSLLQEAEAFVSRDHWAEEEEKSDENAIAEERKMEESPHLVKEQRLSLCSSDENWVSLEGVFTDDKAGENDVDKYFPSRGAGEYKRLVLDPRSGSLPPPLPALLPPTRLPMKITKPSAVNNNASGKEVVEQKKKNMFDSLDNDDEDSLEDEEKAVHLPSTLPTDNVGEVDISVSPSGRSLFKDIVGTAGLDSV